MTRTAVVEPEHVEPGPEVTVALAALSADPFVQAAVWRVWMYGPGILSSDTSLMITQAHVRDFEKTRSSS